MGSNQSTQALILALDVLSQNMYEGLSTAKDHTDRTEGSPDCNIVHSPLQCYLTLIILCTALEGQSKRDFQELLHLSIKAGDDSILKGILQLLQDVQETKKITRPGTRITLKSSLYVTKEYRGHLQPTFMKFLGTLRDTFDLQFVDFTNALLKPIVDSWSKKSTGGLITCSTGKQKPIPSLFHVDLFALVDQFDISSADAKTYASDMSFHGTSNNVCTTAATCVVGRFLYVHDVTHKIRVVKFPLKMNSMLDALIVLPEKRDGLEGRKFRSFMHEQVRMWLESFTVASELEVWMPRIKVTSTVEMTKLLGEVMGASSPFTEGADFSGMAQLRVTPLHMSSIHANYHLDLSFGLGEGTQGDIGEIEDNIYQCSPRIPFRVEHPFMVLIVHRTSKAVFLIAHVHNL